MSTTKKRRLDSAIVAIHERYGPQAVRMGAAPKPAAAIPHIATGFPALDAITGCQGLPLGALTLLSGRTTSGKLTVAYKVLASAQRSPHGAVAHTVALFDLTRTADPDYLARCGVDLDALLVARPSLQLNAVDLLGDLVQQRRLRAVVVDSLTEWQANHAVRRHLYASLGRLQTQLRSAQCALVFLDDPSPPWRRWFYLDQSGRVRWHAALHIEMRREQWLTENGTLKGYRAQARLLKSRWAATAGIPGAPVEIRYNGTVQAGATW
jgi:recombination protein RecA